MTVMHDYTGTHSDQCSVVDDYNMLREADVQHEDAIAMVASEWRYVTEQMVRDFLTDAGISS